MPTPKPSRLQIVFGSAIYVMLFGAIAFGLTMASQEYPPPPITNVR